MEEAACVYGLACPGHDGIEFKEQYLAHGASLTAESLLHTLWHFLSWISE
jgi:hypothetical protein